MVIYQTDVLTSTRVASSKVASLPQLKRLIRHFVHSLFLFERFMLLKSNSVLPHK
jgi:hypothetical protein